MKVTCPSCYAAFPLEAALGADAARSALVHALSAPGPLGRLLARYLGLFRPRGRALAFERVDRLLAELQPMLDAQTVIRNGIARRCPAALWQQALERVIEHRDSGKLKLPLKTHGYLLEIAFGLADQADAQDERETEQRRRRGERQGQTMHRLDYAERAARIRGDVQLGLLSQDDADQKLRALDEEFGRGS